MGLGERRVYVVRYIECKIKVNKNFKIKYFRKTTKTISKVILMSIVFVYTI